MQNQETSAFQSKRLFRACAMAACFFSTAAMAQSGSTGASGQLDPQAQYRMDVERCKSGQTNQDQATCMREAGAALEEAKRHRLLNQQAGNFDQNATERCNRLPAGDREDCVVQMTGQNTTVQGSIAGGGVLRTTTITIPGDGSYPASTAPSTTTSPGAPIETRPAPGYAPTQPMPAEPMPGHSMPGSSMPAQPGTMNSPNAPMQSPGAPMGSPAPSRY